MAGCQIIPIDLNFHLQKCLEIFDKNSADKIQLKNYKEVNPPCLMPIRVKAKIADDFFICLLEAHYVIIHFSMSKEPVQYLYLQFRNLIYSWWQYSSLST